MSGAQAARARGLYRRLLRLHRALPPALRALGDRYVRDEFRRHRAVGPVEAQRFLREWEDYSATLWQQVSEGQHSREKARFGTHLSEEKLNHFRGEQIGQLQELMQEATKPTKQFNICSDSEQKN